LCSSRPLEIEFCFRLLHSEAVGGSDTFYCHNTRHWSSYSGWKHNFVDPDCAIIVALIRRCSDQASISSPTPFHPELFVGGDFRANADDDSLIATCCWKSNFAVTGRYMAICHTPIFLGIYTLSDANRCPMSTTRMNCCARKARHGCGDSVPRPARHSQTRRTKFELEASDTEERNACPYFRANASHVLLCTTEYSKNASRDFKSCKKSVCALRKPLSGIVDFREERSFCTTGRHRQTIQQH
jgi:hypothetical protein